MDGHLLVNVIIVAIGVCLWLGNRKRSKAVHHKELGIDYAEYLVKLKYILDTSELEIFKIAAKEFGFPEYRAEEDFSRYLKESGTVFPMYVKRFLDEGKDHIDEIKVATWRSHMPW